MTFIILSRTNFAINYLRHVVNVISSILFIMQINDVEIRLPCQEGTLEKASQLALVKNKKVHDKSRQENKGKLPKSSRKAYKGKT